MKKMFTMITTAVLLTANLSVGTVARAEDIECNHNFVEETTIVHHDAEYATKTIWAKVHWTDYIGENYLPKAPNEYIVHDIYKQYGYLNYTGGLTYVEDLMTYYQFVSYGLGGLDYLDFPDDVFYERITADNYEEYGWNYEYFCSQTTEYDGFGNLNPEFNPELDELVIFTGDAVKAGKQRYDQEYAGDDIFNPISETSASWSFMAADGTGGPYMPIAQYQIPITEAYDEEVTQYVCSECGQEGTKNADGTITVDLPAETTEPPAETTTTTVTTTTAAESTTTTTTAETTTPTETTTTAPSTYVVMSGDYNGDKEKSVADAILLARFVAEDSDLSAEQLQKIISAEPDYNGDDLVTIHDITAFLSDLR